MTRAQMVGKRSGKVVAPAEATLWNMSHDIIATANVKGYLVQVNPAWRRLDAVGRVDTRIASSDTPIAAASAR